MGITKQNAAPEFGGGKSDAHVGAKKEKQKKEVTMPPTGNEPQTCFVWLPKTAGSSLTAYLNIDARWDRPETGPGQRPVTTFSHCGLQALVRAGHVTPEWLAGVRLFSVVRHPHERAVSLFRYQQRRGDIPRSVRFADFVEALWARRAEIPDPGPTNLIRWPGCTWAANQWAPQHKWLDGLGDVRLLRFERLHEDVGALVRDWGLATTGDLIPRVNAGRRTDARRWYNRPGLKEKITELYAEDFRRFGYSPW